MAEILTREQEAFAERLFKVASEAAKEITKDDPDAQRKIKVTGSVSFKPLTIHVSVEW